MAIRKYASLENVQVLDLKGSRTRVRHASLGKLADFESYRTEDGFLYARIRAISSRVNKNHDGWPSIELAGGQDVFDRHLSSEGFTITADGNREFGFSTFLGKPIFIDHHNSNPSRTRGAIVDAKFHVDDHKTASLDPYYSSKDVDPEHLPGSWVELLLEVDAKSFPKFAKAIVEGGRNPKKGIDGWSMGCDVEKSVCSICKNAASSPDEYCTHIKLKGAHFDSIDSKGHKTSKKAYENCYGVKFFEISGVFDPADETALSREVRSSVSPARQQFTPVPHEHDWDPTGEHFAGFARYAAKKEKEEEEMQDTVPPKKTLQGLVDQKAEELLEESGEEHLERKKNSNYPFLPGTAMACPNCGGKDPQCPMCDGYGYFEPPHPAGDGPMYPEMNQENTQPMPKPVTDSGYLTAPPEFRNDPRWSSTHTADNPLPQAEMSHAPEQVDTLREEETCPVCGSSMDEDTCDVCGYQQEPDGFGNPDLTKAKDVDLPEQGDQQAPEASPEPVQLEPGGGQDVNTPPNPTSLAHVTNDANKTSARINKVERPVVATDKPATNEPKEKILSDQLQPVTSRVRTAQDFIAAAGANRRNTEMKHTADGATAEAVSAPDVKTEVVGVGGVDEASNEAASKADAQIDVTGIGEAGTASVSAEQEGVNVEQGSEHSKNIEAIPTKTWSDGQGDSLGQHEPVTSEPFPASADGVKATSNWHVMGYDDAPFPDDEIEGGTAVKGVKPHSETFGERVDVLDHVTSPGNNSGPTKTWSGTDGNGVLKQQDPVTTDSIARGESEMEGAPNWTSSTHIFTAFKLARMEVGLGMISSEQEFARAAELEKESPAVLSASLAYAQRVGKTASRKTATAQKLPTMGRSASVEKEAEAPEATEDDSFMFGGV